MKLLTCFPLNSGQLDRIQAAVPDWQIVTSDQDTVAQQILDCDVFCGHGRHHQIDWPSVVARGRLKWIQSSAAGMDHCLKPAVIESDIVVSGCSGLFCDSVAEQTMALLFGLIRSVPTFFRAQLNKQFVRQPTDDLHSKVVGILGFGGNGQRIAELLEPIGNRVVATDRYDNEWKQRGRLPDNVQLFSDSDIERVLEQSDVLIVTLPLDSSTEAYVNADRLSRLPDGGYLINVGRGRLVDEPALIDSLRTGKLKAAGLDVTWHEPLPPDSPLWDEPNVMISPHVGAQSAGRYDLVVDLLIENLERFQQQLPLKNRVDKRIGFSLPHQRS